jgi:IS30 family transposase
MSKQGIALREPAKAMGRSHTTLSRELRRNTGQRAYRHHQAQRLAEQRHQAKPKVLKLTETVVAYIQEKLQAWWSPEYGNRFFSLTLTNVCPEFGCSPPVVLHFYLRIRK